MSSQRVALVLFVAVGGMAALAQAQTRPDFTGTWVVETVTVERPSGGMREGGMGPGGAGGRGGRIGGGGRGGRMGGSGGGGRGGGMRGGSDDGGFSGPMMEKGQRVRIRQTRDRLIVTTETPDGEVMTSYTLDGSESSNAGPHGAMVKSKTKWDGVALVTDSTQKMSGPPGDRTLKWRQVRSLAEDSRTMTVRTTIDTPRGKLTSTATLMRVDAPN